MADIWNKRKRSEVMSLIRSHGNKATELRLVTIFKRHGITGWRRHQPVFGKPDFVFPKLRLCVFVDGCFWHGCPTHGTWPKQNEKFWSAKIIQNRARDQRVSRELRAAGWKVIRIWEHSLKLPGPVIARIRRALAADPLQPRIAKENARNANPSSPSGS